MIKSQQYKHQNCLFWWWWWWWWWWRVTLIGIVHCLQFVFSIMFIVCHLSNVTAIIELILHNIHLHLFISIKPTHKHWMTLNVPCHFYSFFLLYKNKTKIFHFVSYISNWDMVYRSGGKRWGMEKEEENCMQLVSNCSSSLHSLIP